MNLNNPNTLKEGVSMDKFEEIDAAMLNKNCNTSK